jgi:hypothetical protein
LRSRRRSIVLIPVGPGNGGRRRCRRVTGDRRIGLALSRTPAAPAAPTLSRSPFVTASFVGGLAGRLGFAFVVVVVVGISEVIVVDGGFGNRCS